MKCSQCKTKWCCKGMEFPILNNDYEEWVLAHEIKVIESNGIKWAHFDIKCPKLKNGKCSIYENRPNVCKNWYCNEHDSFSST